MCSVKALWVASRQILLTTPLDLLRNGIEAPVLVPLDGTPVPRG